MDDDAIRSAQRTLWQTARIAAEPAACVGVAALLTGAAVAMAGVIGFVGLAAPHTVRWGVGGDPGRVLLPSALAGACLVTAADLIGGRFAEVNYKVIPSVIYTAPEIAWVGQSEEQVKASGVAYKIGSFPFAASGRARAMEAGAGFAKIVAASDSDEILGVHIIGPMAGELIAEAVLAMEYAASCEDLQRTIHAHPTLSEAVHEAALAADKRAIDSINR